MSERIAIVVNSNSDMLLDEIGGLLSTDPDYPAASTLLYAELGPNVIGESIFKDLGDRVLFRWPEIADLPSALLDLWESQSGNYRWAELEYLLRNGRFEVTYVYPESIDPEEDVVERRARSVRRHFGDKPIVYPPLAPDGDSPDYEL